MAKPPPDADPEKFVICSIGHHSGRDPGGPVTNMRVSRPYQDDHVFRIDPILTPVWSVIIINLIFVAVCYGFHWGLKHVDAGPWACYGIPVGIGLVICGGVTAAIYLMGANAQRLGPWLIYDKTTGRVELPRQGVTFGVYCGDRDSFIFLVNPDRRIDDGDGGLMRGVFISNSEVGKTSFRITTFLLQNVCSNHIVWGASDLHELKLIHKGRANTRFGSELILRLRRYNDARVIEEERMIRAAKLYELGKDGDSVIDRLFDVKSLDLARRDLEGAWDMAVKWEKTAGTPPTTVWGFVHGLTRWSQTYDFADVRSTLDAAGGKILGLAV